MTKLFLECAVQSMSFFFSHQPPLFIIPPSWIGPESGHRRINGNNKNSYCFAPPMAWEFPCNKFIIAGYDLVLPLHKKVFSKGQLSHILGRLQR